VATDFVELPSQLYEHWLETPEILKAFAIHHRTGEPMPDALIAKLRAARTFNQGFTTVEYVACAIVDLDFHSLETADDLDAAAFERAALDRIGMPEEIAMRHRPPHFSHGLRGRPIFGGLLQLYVVGGLGRRCVQRFPGNRQRVRSGDRRAALPVCLFGRRLARARRRLYGLPRPAADRGGAAEAAWARGRPPPRRDHGAPTPPDIAGASPPRPTTPPQRRAAP